MIAALAALALSVVAIVQGCDSADTANRALRAQVRPLVVGISSRQFPNYEGSGQDTAVASIGLRNASAATAVNGVAKLRIASVATDHGSQRSRSLIARDTPGFASLPAGESLRLTITLERREVELIRELERPGGLGLVIEVLVLYDDVAGGRWATKWSYESGLVPGAVPAETIFVARS